MLSDHQCRLRSAAQVARLTVYCSHLFYTDTVASYGTIALTAPTASSSAGRSLRCNDRGRCVGAAGRFQRLADPRAAFRSAFGAPGVFPRLDMMGLIRALVVTLIQDF